MDLYETLKVKKNASKDTIKKNFRKRARETHPDTGGDQKSFAMVQLAYDVLSDDAKCDRYDRTGEFDEKPDNEIGNIMSVLGGMYMAAIEHFLSAGQAPHEIDLKKMIGEGIDQNIKDMTSAILKAKNKLAALDKLKGRWTCKETNFMEQATLQAISECSQSIKQIEGRAELFSRAKAFLKKYSLKADSSQPIRFTIKFS